MVITPQVDKFQEETFIVGVNFAPLLTSGETVTLIGSTCTETTTTVPLDTIKVSEVGSLNLQGTNTLVVRIMGGTPKHKYRLSFLASTNLGNEFKHDIFIKVL